MPPNLTELNATLSRIVPGGLDMSLMGLSEGDESAGTFKAKGRAEHSQVPDGAVKRVSAAVYSVVRSSIEESEIDYDVKEFERDLAKVLATRAEAALKAGLSEADATQALIAEAFKKIRSLTPGGPKTKRVQVLTGTDKILSRRDRKKNRVSRKKAQKRWARSAAGKKYRMRLNRANRKDRASGKMESSSAAGKILALLGEESSRDLNAVGRELDEAYFRVFSVAATLADFFEGHGEGPDVQISDALCTVIESMDSDVSTLVEGDGGDLAGRLQRLQAWGKSITEALAVFESYSMDGDDDGEDEYDDEDGEDDEDDEDEGND
jgi:hypothetical protein